MDLQRANIYFVSKLNGLLSYNYVRAFLFLVTGVFMGYTLYPVPKVLDNMFMKSYWFKFAILFIASSVAVYPVSSQGLVVILVTTFLALYAFTMARAYDRRNRSPMEEVEESA